MQISNQWEEIGEARGEARGIAVGEARGQAKVVLKLLARQFGPVPGPLAERLRNLPADRVDALADDVLDGRFGSIDALARRLAEGDADVD